MLIVLALLASFTLLSLAMLSRDRAEPVRPLPRPPGRLMLPGASAPLLSLRPGDVVSHLGVDYLVEGVLSLDDDGKVTRLVRLADGARVRWLAVRPGLDELLLLEAVPALLEAGAGSSAPERLEHQGAPYRLSARALSRVARSGALGALPEVERAWVWEYAGAGTLRLLALGWGDRLDAFAGSAVARSLIEVLPA